MQISSIVEQIERDAGADDVGDGIDRADFVEMNFFDGDAVDPRFGFAEPLKDGEALCFARSGSDAASIRLTMCGKMAVLRVLRPRCTRNLEAATPPRMVFSTGTLRRCRSC